MAVEINELRNQLLEQSEEKLRLAQQRSDMALSIEVFAVYHLLSLLRFNIRKNKVLH